MSSRQTRWRLERLLQSSLFWLIGPLQGLRLRRRCNIRAAGGVQLNSVIDLRSALAGRWWCGDDRCVVALAASPTRSRLTSARGGRGRCSPPRPAAQQRSGPMVAWSAPVVAGAVYAAMKQAGALERPASGGFYRSGRHEDARVHRLQVRVSLMLKPSKVLSRRSLAIVTLCPVLGAQHSAIRHVSCSSTGRSPWSLDRTPLSGPTRAWRSSNVLFLPDLSIAQVMFLVGSSLVAILGAVWTACVCGRGDTVRRRRHFHRGRSVAAVAAVEPGQDRHLERVLHDRHPAPARRC